MACIARLRNELEDTKAAHLSSEATHVHKDTEIEDMRAELERLTERFQDQKLQNAEEGKLQQGAQEELLRMHEAMEQTKQEHNVKDGTIRDLQQGSQERSARVAQLTVELQSLREELAVKEEECEKLKNQTETSAR